MRTITLLLLLCSAAFAQTTRPNILLITADDMNFDTPGYAGCKVPDITPNLDRLAAGGIYFKHAHVTVAVCQPSRSAIMTGRYPHRNGTMGFTPIRDDVPTLGEQLNAAGYLNGVFAKVAHMRPIEKFKWDVIVEADELGVGRDANAYHKHAKEFFARARSENKPFFLNANAQDPHRPFAGSDGEKARNTFDEDSAPRRPNRAARARAEAGKFPGVTRTYKPEEVTVPGFLPDLPDVRKEMAQYYTSAHRCDEVVGAILKALDETGLADSTLVMFLSDHGISQPFAKSNCYPTSTRTPWVARWPGKIKPGQVDDAHFISGIDFLPTILDAVGLPPLAGVDGRSFLGIARGETASGRDSVVTVYHETVAKREFPMRCVQDKDFAYIFSGWSDGKTEYRSEPMGGLAFKTMQAAAATQPAIAQRVKMLVYRVPEELYDLQNDPDALQNLIDEPAHAARAREMRGRLLKWMEQTQDPLIGRFRMHISR
jgi:N-sulfoglucosamine sulfohydrolase